MPPTRQIGGVLGKTTAELAGTHARKPCPRAAKDTATVPHRVVALSLPRRTQHRHVESTMCDHTYSFWSSSLKRDRSSTIAGDTEPIRQRQRRRPRRSHGFVLCNASAYRLKVIDDQIRRTPSTLSPVQVQVIGLAKSDADSQS